MPRPLSTGRNTVTGDGNSTQTGDTVDDSGIRAVHEEDAAGGIFWRDGAGGTVGKVVRLDRSRLSEARERAAVERVGTDAADLLSAAAVQLVGPGGGRGVVRLRDAATVRRIDLG